MIFSDFVDFFYVCRILFINEQVKFMLSLVTLNFAAFFLFQF